MEQNDYILSLFDQSSGISTDSRTILEGQLYFGLKGPSFNGNSFAKDALERGAFAAIVDEEKYVIDDRCILVENSLISLQSLANAHRKRFDIPVIGITGTNGKTTTKEILHSVIRLQYDVLTTRGNFNNHIGVPLTLLELKSKHNFAIIEMGASAEGEIDLLCKIAAPTAGLITNIGKAHLEGFGTEGAIKRTKSELYNYLNKNGGLIFMPDHLLSMDFFRAKNYSNLIRFSADDLRGQFLKSIQLLGSNPFLDLVLTDSDNVDSIIHTRLFGSYNFTNVMNVLKIADHFGISTINCIKGIEHYHPSNNRSQLIEKENNNSIVMDAYNANPSSVKVALDHFVSLETGKRKVIILGDMLELGSESLNEHGKILKLLHNNNILSAVVGNEFFRANQLHAIKFEENILFFRNTEEASLWWIKSEIKDAIILLKGSRGIALEKIFV